MRAFTVAVAGLGVAALLFAAPPAGADHHEGKKAGASAPSGEGATGGGTGSEARGTGQAGTSTGARPGEVTGAPAAPEGTSAREQQAAAAADQELSGKVEAYDRQERTLSLSGSDRKLRITDQTQVTRDGTRISPGQIMEGDEVRASYSGSGEVVDAAVIEVTPGAASSGGAPSQAAPGSSADPSGGSPKGAAPGTKGEPATGSGGTR